MSYFNTKSNSEIKKLALSSSIVYKELINELLNESYTYLKGKGLSQETIDEVCEMAYKNEANIYQCFELLSIMSYRNISNYKHETHWKTYLKKDENILNDNQHHYPKEVDEWSENFILINDKISPVFKLTHFYNIGNQDIYFRCNLDYYTIKEILVYSQFELEENYAVEYEFETDEYWQILTNCSETIKISPENINSTIIRIDLHSIRESMCAAEVYYDLMKKMSNSVYKKVIDSHVNSKLNSLKKEKLKEACDGIKKIENKVSNNDNMLIFLKEKFESINKDYTSIPFNFHIELTYNVRNALALLRRISTK